MGSGRATIYDIAEEAGVSIATVSRVLRGESSVSEKTKEKVAAAIAHFNYHPSSIARGLTSNVTHSLGIVLPKLLNPNYAMIFTGAQEAARKQGYTVSLFPWSSLNLTGSDAAMTLASRRLDGLIVCVEYLPKEQEESLRTALLQLRELTPVVLIGCVHSGYDLPYVTYNMADMMKEIVAYLVSLGHERIAFIGGTDGDMDPHRRDVGYEEGLKEAQLPYTASYRVYGKATAEAGKSALTGLLDSLRREYWPTAVIAINDLVAMGCQIAAREKGIRMPEELSFIGCDNLFCSPYLYPALTSVDTHQQKVGSRAVEMLIHGENAREQADWELVIRDSCAPAKP